MRTQNASVYGAGAAASARNAMGSPTIIASVPGEVKFHSSRRRDHIIERMGEAFAAGDLGEADRLLRQWRRGD